MLVRCPGCARTYEKKVENDIGGITSEMCADCYAEFYKDDLDDLRDILAEKKLQEFNGIIVWQGEKKIGGRVEFENGRRHQ